MRPVRQLVTLVAVLCVFFADPGIAAPQGEDPYWTSDTTSPVETIAGEWTASDDGNSAELTITGVNLPAQRTTFEAGWVTPWTRGGGFSEEGQIDLLITPDTSVMLKRMSRYQVPGRRWSGWMTHRLPYEEGSGMGGSGSWASGQGFAIPLNGRPQKVRYEWRIVGSIEGSANLSSSISLSLD